MTEVGRGAVTKLVVLAAACSAAYTLTYSLFMPALTAAAADMQVPVPTIQLTMAAYLAVLAVIGPVVGSMSDRLGSRRILLFGIGLFAIGSTIVGFATSLPLMYLGRILQAVGSCAGVVIPRAIVQRQLGPKAPSTITLVTSLMAMLTAIGPIIGGLMVDFFGWRSGLFFLAIYGVMLFFAIQFGFKERERVETRSASVWTGLKWLLRSRSFMGLALVGGLYMSAFQSVIIEAPFVLTSLLGLSPTGFGLIFSIMPMSYATAGLGISVLSRYFSSLAILRIGVGLGVLGSLWALGSFHAGLLSVPVFMSWLVIFNIANAFVLPMSIASVLSLNPRLAGSASGVVTTLHSIMNALGVLLVGLLHEGTILTIIVVVVAPAFLAPALFWWATRKMPTAA